MQKDFMSKIQVFTSTTKLKKQTEAKTSNSANEHRDKNFSNRKSNFAGFVSPKGVDVLVFL